MISGKLQFKLDDEIVELSGPEAMRVPPVTCAASGTTSPRTPSS